MLLRTFGSFSSDSQWMPGALGPQLVVQGNKGSGKGAGLSSAHAESTRLRLTLTLVRADPDGKRE